MGAHTSYFLYQKYEKRGEQDLLPVYPNVYSVDGEGTMPLVMKQEEDEACGTPQPCLPMYSWTPIPVSEDYTCDECDINIQTRWVDYENAFTYFGDYKYGIQILDIKVEDGEWTRTNQTKYTTNPIGKAEPKIIAIDEDGYYWHARCGSSDGKYYNYPGGDIWFFAETTDNSGLIDDYKFCEIGPPRSAITSITFGECVTCLSPFDCDTDLCEEENPDGYLPVGYGPKLKSITFNGDVEGLIPGGYFMGNTGLTSISIPSGITALGPCEIIRRFCDGNGTYGITNGAFKGCGLENVHTNNVQIIGGYCFADNLNLNKITIGSACTRLDPYVFNNCPNLQQIIFEGTTVPDCRYVNINSSKFEYINVPWMLTMYEAPNPDIRPYELPPDCKIYVPCEALETFKNSTATTHYTDIIYGYGGECGDIPPVVLQPKVKSITYLIDGVEYTRENLLNDETGVFSSDDVTTLKNTLNTGPFDPHSFITIKSIEFGDTIHTIADKAFSGTVLISISGTVNLNRVTTIGNNAFHNNMFESIVIPNSVTSIGSWAFSRPTDGPDGYIRSLTIGSGITSIPEGCFYKAVDSMTSLSIPDNITSIGEDAFYGCENLAKLHIGSGITSIATNAFYRGYNTGFTNITIEALIPPTIAFSSSYSCFDDRTQINVHCSVIEDYIDDYITNGNYKGSIDSIESDCT